jgi:hypothetical protein
MFDSTELYAARRQSAQPVIHLIADKLARPAECHREKQGFSLIIAGFSDILRI